MDGADSGQTDEFSFLSDIEPALESRYRELVKFLADDPGVALLKGRLFLEGALRNVAKAHGATPQSPFEKLWEFIDRLYKQSCLPPAIADIADVIRWNGNKGGAHEGEASPKRAQQTLDCVREFARWLRQDTTGQPYPSEAAALFEASIFAKANNAKPRPGVSKHTASVSDDGPEFPFTPRVSARRAPSGDSTPRRGAPGRSAPPDTAQGLSRFHLGRLPALAAGGVLVVAILWGLTRCGHKKDDAQAHIAKFPAPLAEVVSTAMANVRSGPGSKFAPITQLHNGDPLTGIGTAPADDGGVWQYVQLANGANGYVNSKLLQVAAPPQPAQTPTPPDTPATPAAATTPATVIAPPDPPAPVIDEATRVHQIVTSTNFYHDGSPGSGEVPGQSMMLRVDVSYANARSGDVAQGVIFQNGQVVSRCNDIPLDPNGGSVWCRTPVYAPGDYLFELGINGTPVASHEFVIPGVSNAPAPVYVAPQQQRIFRPAAPVQPAYRPSVAQPQGRPAATPCCARQPASRPAPARAPDRRPYPH